MLSKETSFLLKFGARFCDGVSNIEISFVSQADGQEHKYKPYISLPNDHKRHTYMLDWWAEADSYAIIVDDKDYKNGKISEHFENLMTDNVSSKKKPRSWVEEPYHENEELLEELNSIRKYIPDPNEVIPPYTNLSDWKPKEVVNPEYERKYAEYVA